MFFVLFLGNEQVIGSHKLFLLKYFMHLQFPPMSMFADVNATKSSIEDRVSPATSTVSMVCCFQNFKKDISISEPLIKFFDTIVKYHFAYFLFRRAQLRYAHNIAFNISPRVHYYDFLVCIFHICFVIFFFIKFFSMKIAKVC